MKTDEYNSQGLERVEQSDLQTMGGDNSLAEFSGFEAQDEFMSSTSASRKINFGSLLIVIVVVIAAGAIFAMRTLARVSEAFAGNAEVDKVIDSFLDSQTGDNGLGSFDSLLVDNSDSPLNILDDNYTEMQVPLANVQRNPFILDGDHDTDAAPPVDANPGDESLRLWETRRAEREIAIESARSRLVLKSVMMGTPKLANLNDRIVREGDTVVIEPGQIEFKVTEIALDAVVLVATDELYDLEIEMRVQVDGR